MGTSNKNLPFIVVFVIIISILFLSQILSTDFRIKILNIFRMPLKIISSSYYVLRDVSSFKELVNENEILRGNIDSLENKVLNLQEIRLENKRLKKLLGFVESGKRKFIPSMVIARDVLGVRDTIIIDKGKKDKILKDKAVISGNGLVGRVRECGWNISRVLLITDRDSAVSAIVQRTRDEGVVTGGMPSGLIMKYLELDCDIEEGDDVISSGFSGVFEKGIMIGKIIRLEKDSRGLYLNAIIEPEVDMMKLEEVLVVK